MSALTSIAARPHTHMTIRILKLTQQGLKEKAGSRGLGRDDMVVRVEKTIQIEQHLPSKYGGPVWQRDGGLGYIALPLAVSSIQI
jgi:hypothetical protein